MEYGSPEEKEALARGGWLWYGGGCATLFASLFLFGLFFAATGDEANMFFLLIAGINLVGFGCWIMACVRLGEARGSLAPDWALGVLGPFGPLVVLMAPDRWQASLDEAARRPESPPVP